MKQKHALLKGINSQIKHIPTPRECSVKETKELVVGLLAISALLAKEFKDGVQVADFADIIAKVSANEELKAKIVGAYSGVEKVPSEVKDATVAEVIEILSAALPELLKIIEAVKA